MPNNKTQTGTGRTWTYKDFPEFYNNAFVQSIANKEKWRVSDKYKRPLDMRALIDKQVVWGMANNRGYNPLVDLQTLINVLPDATNNAYHLETAIDKFVVLDIEPKCPDVIKEQLLKLPYLYGETSMSGKGVHLVFDLPKELWKEYPVIHDKLAIKESHGYYEILLNHMVTFTRNALPETVPEKEISEFEKLFEKLASEAKPTAVASCDISIDEIDTDSIPYYGRTMTVLRAQKYRKKPEDFSNDMSRYEFGMAGFYWRALKRLLKNPQYSNAEYTDEQKAIVIYVLLSENLEFREKHDSQRNGMPWLLHLATQIISKSDDKNED
jgi:hypothetical protein